MTINDNLKFPSDPTNLSPALQGLVAQILTPNQYGRIMRDAVTNVNAQCKGAAQYIGK